MLQIDLESQRAKRAIRFFTYGLMTMATLVLTAVVILLSQGYRFDRNQFGVVREGLLQLASHPVDVHYKINGKEYKSLTPDKQTLPAGTYTIELFQNGYRPWQKDIEIEEGRVHWVNYPRLIPSSLSTKTVKDYENVTFAKTSPDKRWIIMNAGNPDKDKLELVDLKDPQNPVSKTITIPSSQLAKKDDAFGELSFVEWSLDSKMFVVRHKNGDITEYIRIDREHPEEAININMKFQLAMDEVHFSGGNTNLIYARTGDVLRRFDIGANTATGALVDGLKDFQVYGEDIIAYSRLRPQKEGQEAALEVGFRQHGKATVLKTFPAGTEVNVLYSEFDHHNYFVAIDRTSQTTTILRDINEVKNRKQVFAEFSGIAPAFAKFSPNSRFLLLQQGKKFGVYDFYEQKKYGYTIEGLSEDRPVQWLDNFHLAGVKGKVLQTWDFDGTNVQSLVAAQPGLDAVLDEDDDILYTLTKAEEGSTTTRPFNLTSTNMKVKE